MALNNVAKKHHIGKEVSSNDPILPNKKKKKRKKKEKSHHLYTKSIFFWLNDVIV